MKPTLNKLTLLLFVACTAAGICGCVKDGTPEPRRTEDEQKVTIQLKVPGSPYTRAPEDPDKVINTIDVLSFSEETGLLYYRAAAYDIDPAQEKFDIILYKGGAGTQRLIVLANLRSEIEQLISDGDLKEGKTTISELKEMLTFDFVHKQTKDGLRDESRVFGENRPLPMWGERESVLVHDAMDLGTIPLLRSLATVSVALSSDLPANKLRIEEIVIWNTDYKGRAIPAENRVEYDPDGASYEKVMVTKPTEVAGAGTGRAYFDCPSGSSLVNTIYVAEKDNHVQDIDECEQSWLVIGGYYEGSTEKTWYRQPFKGKDGLLKDILRNHNYIFTITSVDGPGSKTEEGALETDLTASVTEWDQGADIHIDMGISNVWVEKREMNFDWRPLNYNSFEVKTDYSGVWYAFVSTSPDDPGEAAPEWILPKWNAKGIIGNGTVDFDVRLNADDIGRNAYIHICAGSMDVVTKVYQIGKEAYVPTTGENCYMTDSNNPQTFEITVWDQVSRALEKFGNGVAADNPAGNAWLDPEWLYIARDGKWRVEVLWSDIDEFYSSNAVVESVEFIGDETQGIYTSDAKIRITTGRGKGNALVILYRDINDDGLKNTQLPSFRYYDERIVWSWHIWNTDYRPDLTDLSKPANLAASGRYTKAGMNGSVYKHHTGTKANTFMDRNLGANPDIDSNGIVDFGGPSGDKAKILKTYGLYYQFGRKDPFPGPQDNNTARPSGRIYYPYPIVWDYYMVYSIQNYDNNFFNTVSHPLFHYYEGVYRLFDWLTSYEEFQNHYLWEGKEQRETKTMFDPCPAGWKVPRTDYANAADGGGSAWGLNGYDIVGTSAQSPALYINDITAYPVANILGYYFDKTDPSAPYCLGYYPLAGYRGNSNYPESGDWHIFTEVGLYGYTRSSSVREPTSINTQKMPLYFRLTSSAIQNRATNVRSYAIPVRCVADN